MKLNWGNYIFIFILFFLTLCTIFIVFSLRQDIDLVTDNYYEEGAEYSSQMEVQKRSENFMDSIIIGQYPDAITFSIAGSLKVSTNSLNIWFYRPSDKEADFRSDLAIIDDSPSISKKYLTKGRYIVHVSWEMDSEKYMIKKDIFIK